MLLHIWLAFTISWQVLVDPLALDTFTTTFWTHAGRDLLTFDSGALSISDLVAGIQA